MRDKKISILLFVSFLLLISSFLILCTWVYNYYNQDKIASKTIIKVVPETAHITRDSLLKIYTHTIQSMENQLGNTYTKSDSIESELSIKLDEYYRLKDEVVNLLKSPSSNDDFKTAIQKVSTLQQNLEAIRNTSSAVKQENLRLNRLITELNKDHKESVQYQNKGESIVVPVVNTQKKPGVANPAFYASDMNLMSVKPDDEEQDVFSIQRQIVGTFVLKNSDNVYNSEVTIIVIQPNGRVLQKSAWESGSFQSNDGKKIYSLKISIEKNDEEVKKISFSIADEKFSKGNYTMQIYTNGKMIGKVTKLLS